MFRREHNEGSGRPARSGFPDALPSVHAGDADGVEELVARAASGDEAAFAEIFARYATNVYRSALARCGEHDLAEDLVAETFLVAWRRIPDYTFTGAPFVTWLLAISTRLHATAMRSRARKPTTTIEMDHDVAASGADMFSPLANRDEVERLLSRLPLDERQVLVLRFLVDLSAEDTALALGTTSAIVRQLQLRALRRLRCHHSKAHAA